MRKFILSSIISILICQFANAQESETIEIGVKKNSVVYLSLDSNKELDFQIDEDVYDSRKKTKRKNNFINVYFEWINPLKYKISWKDSIMSDERDKVISDFISLLTGPFGTQVSGLNRSDLVSSALMEEDGIEIRDFKDGNLALWLFLLKEKEADIDSVDIIKINLLSAKLDTLDTYNSRNVSSNVTDIYAALMGISDIGQYNSEFPNQKLIVKDIEGLVTGFDKIESLRKTVLFLIESFTLKDQQLLQTVTKTVLSNYIEMMTVKLNKNKKIISKLKPVFTLFENSIKNKSTNPNFVNYYKQRKIEFDDGEKLETIITITEYEFNKDKIEFIKKLDVISNQINFKKYDVLDVFLSTGIFWGNTSLNGFGVANGGVDFTVTEDNIDKNTVITAMFLNFNLMKSRYLSPMFQIGIDPTKKRPFMLLGGGFIIPSARIALSAGPIWTWNQSLEKLTIGQTISNTTELDNDIKYKFDLEPKGWYFGIQYNF